MTPHDDCPLGTDGMTRIMVALERIETHQKDMKESWQKSETGIHKRLEHLEAVEGRHGLVAACISAVIAGLALFGKYIFGGKA